MLRDLIANRTDLSHPMMIINPGIPQLLNPRSNLRNAATRLASDDNLPHSQHSALDATGFTDHFTKAQRISRSAA